MFIAALVFPQNSRYTIIPVSLEIVNSKTQLLQKTDKAIAKVILYYGEPL
jgi:hypothetical protein